MKWFIIQTSSMSFEKCIKDASCCSNLLFPNQTQPMWLALGRFLFHVIQSAPCVYRYCDILLWFISWKAFWSLLIAATVLVPLSDLIRQMLPRLPIYRLRKSIKEPVPKECSISMWTARLHKQINITSYLFNSFQ